MQVMHGDRVCNRRAIVEAPDVPRVQRVKDRLRELHGESLEITVIWVGTDSVALYYVASDNPVGGVG